MTGRQNGTNPRAVGTNPRARGTNPRAVAGLPGTVRDARSVFRTVERAYLALRAAGAVWCESCGDENVIEVAGRFEQCPIEWHRRLSFADAQVVLSMPP